VDKLIPPSPTDDEYARQAAANADESLFDETEPFGLFGQWLAEARESEPNDSNAVALATADAQGRPDARMVLLKGFDARGFVFYTNTQSAKGLQLGANPARGAAVPLEEPAAAGEGARAGGAGDRRRKPTPTSLDAARDARVGAIASDQSRPLPSRAELESRIAAVEASLRGAEPERPAHWSGYRVPAEAVEFWRDRAFRLHDRLLFERQEGGWRRTRLYP
jgi:pyridoxamine 5'-phosphate oxidase